MCTLLIVANSRSTFYPAFAQRFCVKALQKCAEYFEQKSCSLGLVPQAINGVLRNRQRALSNQLKDRRRFTTRAKLKRNFHHRTTPPGPTIIERQIASPDARFSILTLAVCITIATESPSASKG
jgi:hypothetical protein